MAGLPKGCSEGKQSERVLESNKLADSSTVESVSILRAYPTTSRRVALALLLLVAFVLRVWNLNWDEGTHQHPDERYWSIITSEISNTSLNGYFDSSTSTLNPYNLPDRDTWVYGTFPLFTTKAAASFLSDGPFPAGAIATAADAVGIDLRTNGVDDFDGGYNANLIGRLLSALVDTGTVLLVYFLGRNLFDRRVGFVAATLLTFTVLHIQYAHFYGSEPWVTFFVTAGVLASVKIARGDLRVRVATGAGLLFGLAMASKLIAAAALAVPATAIAVAVAPNVADSLQQGWGRLANWERGRVRGFTALGALGIALAILALGPRFLLIALVVLSALALTAASLGIIQRAERSSRKPMVLFDQLADHPQVLVSHEKKRPSWHVPVWGAFTGLIVLVATAATYRIFQPYTFDGIASIDERFTRDLDFLERVNSGGDVPWVVQWIGRTPLLFPLQSAFWWGMGPALGIAVAVGLWRSASDVVRRQRWILLVPLALITVMLGLVSEQFNPLIRYLLPAYPIAVMLGAFGVVWLWDAGRARCSSTSTRTATTGRVLQVVAGALVGGTAFWGLAFVNGVYNTEHPRIEASVWMAENLPPGATISNQIWDDALPLRVPGTENASFTQIAFDPFQADVAINGDSISKTDTLIAGLDRVDYVIEASNRLYDSIPRIPAKYPATTAYYETLFDGRLGFEPIAEFRTSPSLFGLDIPDHFAEETFTVYDHPTVTIWEKTSAFSAERARALLNPAKAGVAPDVIPSEAATNVLQLRPADAAALSTGETFDEQFSSGGLFGSLSWVWWLVWLQISAFAVLPWTTLLFGGLPDKGYGLSKVIGFLAVGLGAWLTVSWGVADFGRGVIWAWFVAIAIVGIALWSRHRDRMARIMRDGRSAWMTAEVAFLGVFALALWMRSANPDLWEPFLGGEKPMEMAYLTSIARASDFPAPDPWFAGGFINYYYFGWYLLTVPMRAMKVLPEVGFNLGVATYAALTAVTAFSVVHNLVAISQTRWAGGKATKSAAPAWAGLVGVLLLLGIGNLDAIRLHYDRIALVNTWETGSNIPILGHIITFVGGNWAWARGAPLDRLDWWQPSRVNRGNFDITEFPYFTFLFGDLHPHMMGLVFVGLTVSLAIAYLVASRSADSHRALLLAVGLGLTTGVARVVNTWDLPSVAIVTGVAIVLGRLLAPVTSVGNDEHRRGILAVLATCGLAAGIAYLGGPGNSVLLALGGLGVMAVVSLVTSWRVRLRLLLIISHAAAVALTHVAVFWPFLRNTETFDTGLQSAVDGSPLDDFLIHWGIFLAISVFFIGALLIDSWRRKRTGEISPGPLPEMVWSSPLWKGAWFGLAAACVALGGLLVTGAAAISIAGVVLFGGLLSVEARRADPDIGRLVAVGLFTLAFAISGGVDVVTVQNDIERMNTVFKFWLQAWVYFAFASAFAIWQVGRIAAERPKQLIHGLEGIRLEIRQDRGKRASIWVGIVSIILIAGLAYPLLATRTRLQTRFADLPATLNGLAYLESEPTIPKLNGSGDEIHVPIGDDLPVIEWIRSNVRGTPAVAEWAGGPYDWSARIAIYTGLPSVIGWDWHQKQQRWSFQPMVDRRIADVQALFTVADEKAVTTFLQAYEVGYVVVGTQEHRFGTPEALGGLATHPALDAVFTDKTSVVYEVNRSALWPGVDLNELELLATGPG